MYFTAFWRMTNTRERFYVLLLEDRKRFFALTGKSSVDCFIPPRFGGRGTTPPADEKY